MRMLDMIAGTEDRLADLLNAEDAKTRRNAALLMGIWGNRNFCCRFIRHMRKSSSDLSEAPI